MTASRSPCTETTEAKCSGIVPLQRGGYDLLVGGCLWRLRNLGHTSRGPHRILRLDEESRLS